MKNKMKTKIRRCQRCRKTTLIDISGEMQNINPFTIRRSYSGILCTSCNWSEKKYTFVEEQEEA